MWARTNCVIKITLPRKKETHRGLLHRDLEGHKHNGSLQCSPVHCVQDARDS